VTVDSREAFRFSFVTNIEPNDVASWTIAEADEGEYEVVADSTIWMGTPVSYDPSAHVKKLSGIVFGLDRYIPDALNLAVWMSIDAPFV